MNDQPKEPVQPWWREKEVFILIVLVLVAYLIRLDAVSMRGEEPRRAQVAFEILQRGDWIVPREQGDPFLSRPPFQNWVIAGSTIALGTRDPWAVRLHSVLAMLFTTLLIYGYSRTCLSRTGALAAAASFATLAEMFTTGAQAETEMLFTALVSGSLLLWHWGQLRGWSATWTWVACYTSMSFAVLCKGPQPPAYFLGSIGGFLFFTGRLRTLFSWAHVMGASVGTAILLAWLIPCVDREGLATVRGIVMSDTGMRFQSWQLLKVAKHLVQYPLEILGSTLPWSPLVLGFASKGFRQTLGDARPITLFMATCILVTFPTCWIPPDAQTRYYMPLYPCLAVLIGVVVDRCLRLDTTAFLRVFWLRYVQALSAIMALGGVSILLGPWILGDHPNYHPWVEKPLTAVAFGLMAIALAWLTYRGRHAGEAAKVRATVLAITAFMTLACTGIVTNIRIRRSEDQATPIARMNEQLPADHRMMSIGHIDALFAYHYGLPIEALPLGVTAKALPDDPHVYYCFDAYVGLRPSLPFAYEEIAAIPMDRYRYPPSFRQVVVVRRIPNPRLQ